MKKAKRTHGCDLEGKIYFVYLVCLAVTIIGLFIYFLVLN